MTRLILASACLCGEPCRYDGSAAPHPLLVDVHKRGMVVAVCPEALGGLPTPRPCCELRGNQVLNAEGRDVTAQFEDGAAQMVALAREKNIVTAVLKEKSPSCGVSRIYDGTFSGVVIPGMGVAARLLARHGLTVYGDTDFTEEKLR